MQELEKLRKIPQQLLFWKQLPPTPLTPLPVPTPPAAAPTQVRLCQTLSLDQSTLPLRAVAAPTVLQRAPAADLKGPHHREKRRTTTVRANVLLRPLRASLGRLGVGGLLVEAVDHPILTVVVEVGEVVMAAVEVALVAPTPDTGSVKQ